MTLKSLLDELPLEKWKNDKVCFRKISSEDDLIYAVFDCKLTDEQAKKVNPAWFSIGRAYIAPENNYPCVICDLNGENIGFICLTKWLGEGDAFSWSYYIDNEKQGNGYGRKTAELAIEILKNIADGKMIKLAVERSNLKAQKLYKSLGFNELAEADGDDLVFGR